MSSDTDGQISEKIAVDKLVEQGVLKKDVAEIIQKMARTRATNVPNLEGANVRALALQIDKSGSMAEHAPAVIEGHRHLINSLLQATLAMKIYLGQILFNHEIEYLQNMAPFRDPAQDHHAHPLTRLLDKQNYVPTGGTALYDTILHGIAMFSPLLNMAEDLGQQIFTNIAIITDGKDECDPPRYQSPPRCSKTKPDELKRVIEFLLEQGIIHRITLFGIGKSDFGAVAKSIGVTDVVGADANPKDIRRIFDLISSQTIGDR